MVCFSHFVFITWITSSKRLSSNCAGELFNVRFTINVVKAFGDTIEPLEYEMKKTPLCTCVRLNLGSVAPQLMYAITTVHN